MSVFIVRAPKINTDNDKQTQRDDDTKTINSDTFPNQHLPVGF
jgi:hypothetical protein